MSFPRTAEVGMRGSSRRREEAQQLGRLEGRRERPVAAGIVVHLRRWPAMGARAPGSWGCGWSGKGEKPYWALTILAQ